MRNVCLVLFLTVFGPTVVSAQEPSTSRPAQGLALQVQVSSAGLSSISGFASTGVLLGYRLENMTIGAQLGFTNLHFVDGDSVMTDADDDDMSATIFALIPTIAYDVWKSADGMARFNIVGAIGIGRATLAETSRVETTPGVFAESTQDLSAWILPLRIGAGGDWYFHPSFSLGLEAGFQGLFAFGLEADDGTTSVESDDAADAIGIYGALRATFILGS